MRKRKDRHALPDADTLFFQKFYEDNKEFMYYIARKYAPNPSDCEEVMQEATLRLIHNIASLQNLNENKIAKYVSLTVKSAFLDCEKRKHHDTLIYLENDAIEALLTERDPQNDLDVMMADVLSVEKLRKSLPPKDWTVLEGKYMLGYTQEELGNILGISPDSVRMALHRAREKARVILEIDAEKERG